MAEPVDMSWILIALIWFNECDHTANQIDLGRPVLADCSYWPLTFKLNAELYALTIGF